MCFRWVRPPPDFSGLTGFPVQRLGFPQKRGWNVYEFLAIGPGIKQTWRRRLPAQEVIRLGRAPKDGWAVPWDMRISREHADLMLEADRLRVRRLSTARNSIYLRGEALEEFTVGPGEDFRIGQTVFRLDPVPSGEGEVLSPPPPSAPDAAAPWTEFTGRSDRQRLQAVLARLDEDDTRLENQAAGEPAPAGSPPSGSGQGLDGNAFGSYEIVDRIHRSSTGQVLKVRHRYLDRWAAIQVLSSAGTSAGAVARFHRRAVLTASFDHENIPRTYEAGQIDGVHYRIMEYVDGRTLARLLVREKLTVQTAVGCVIQAARALAHAHQFRVVHRDVNPSHLLLSQTGTVKLIGWGHAWCPGSNGREAGDDAKHMPGKPGFMAPEQVAGGHGADARTDVYGLGCTLFALLASQAMLPPDWRSGDMARDSGRPAPPLRDARREASEALETVYQKMLAHAPEHRWSSMAEVIAALEQTV